MPNFAADVETLGISAHLCFANFQHIWRCNLASYSNRRDDRMAGSMALQCSMRLSRGTLGSHQVTIHGGGIMGEPWRTFNWLILHDFYWFLSIFQFQKKIHLSATQHLCKQDTVYSPFATPLGCFHRCQTPTHRTNCWAARWWRHGCQTTNEQNAQWLWPKKIAKQTKNIQKHPRWNIGWAAVYQFCRYEIWGHGSPSYKKVCPTQKAALQNDAAGTPHIPRWSLQKATRIFVMDVENRCKSD